MEIDTGHCFPTVKGRPGRMSFEGDQKMMGSFVHRNRCYARENNRPRKLAVASRTRKRSNFTAFLARDPGTVSRPFPLA